MYPVLSVPDLWYVNMGWSFYKCINDDIDLSALPHNSPDLLTAPTATTPVFIAISIVFSTIFFILFTLISLRASLGAKLSVLLDKPALHRASAWLGLLGFMTGKPPRFLGGLSQRSNHVLGLTSFLVIRMWFGKAVEDFNQAIVDGGNNAPQLIAQLSNGFTSTCSCSVSSTLESDIPVVVWVAYAFYGVPLICVLARLHVTNGGK
jgi:hypothetical protein